MLRSVVVLDSCEAWRAPLAGFISQFLMVGFSFSCGLLALELHEDYDVPQQLILPTVLISPGLMLLLSPAVEWISVRFGSKAVMLTSTALISTSLGLAFFLPITGTSVIVLLGVNTGVGRAFGNFVAYKFTMAAFRKRLGLASALLQTGAAAGGIALPPLFALLLDIYGARISLLLSAAIFLHLLVAAALIPSAVVDHSGRLLTPVPAWEDESERHDPPEVVREPLPVRPALLLLACLVAWTNFSANVLATNMLALFASEKALPTFLIAAVLSTKSAVDLCARGLSGLAFHRVGTRGKMLLLPISQLVGLLGITPIFFCGERHAALVLFIHGVTLATADAFTAVGWPQMVTELSGNFYMGRGIAFVMLLCGGSLVTSSLGFGAVRQKVGSYIPAYQFIAACSLLAILGYLLAAALLHRCGRRASKAEISFPKEEQDARVEEVLLTSKTRAGAKR